jgi:hypothetical protein
LIRHQDSGLVFNVAGEISDTRHSYRMFTHTRTNLSWGQIAVAHNPPAPTFILEPPTLIDECVRFRLNRLLEQPSCAVREHLSQCVTDSLGHCAISDSG